MLMAYSMKTFKQKKKNAKDILSRGESQRSALTRALTEQAHFWKWHIWAAFSDTQPTFYTDKLTLLAEAL